MPVRGGWGSSSLRASRSSVAKNVPRPTGEGAGDVWEQLRRILHYERQRGCADTAVIGGLGRFLESWLGRVPADDKARATELISPLFDYAHLSPEARRTAIDAVLAGRSDGEPKRVFSSPAASPRTLGEKEFPSQGGGKGNSSLPPGRGTRGKGASASEAAPHSTRSKSPAMPFVASEGEDTLQASVRS